MKAAIYILLVLLAFSSCTSSDKITRKCHKAQQKYEMAAARWGCPTVKDSTFVQSQVIIKDTTIYVPIPGQTANESVPVIITNGLMSTPLSMLETTYSRSKAWVENGTLKHTLDQRSSSIPVILPGAIHTSTSNSIQTVKVPYYVDRPISKPLSWWQKIFFWTGIIAWWALIGYIAFRISKFTIL